MPSCQWMYYIMPSCQWIRRLRRISGRKRDLLIIISSIILGASTQFLSTHIWNIGNYLLGMFIDGVIHHNCHSAQQSGIALCKYWQESLPGMAVEMVALVVVIVFMIFFFFRRDKNEDKEDEIITILKQIRDSDVVNSRVGGASYAKTPSATKGETKKEDKKGGEAKDN